MKTTAFKRIFSLFCLITVIALFLPCAGAEEAPAFPHPYGVFLGITENLVKVRLYRAKIVLRKELSDLCSRQTHFH